MITQIHYRNFKALRKATLPLGRFTLIVGANGTGKTTAMRALEIAREPNAVLYDQIVSTKLNNKDNLNLTLLFEIGNYVFEVHWNSDDGRGVYEWEQKSEVSNFEHAYAKSQTKTFLQNIGRFQLFSFDAEKIVEPVPVRATIKLESNGVNLAGVLDQIYGNEPEKFEELNQELQNWFPEFDRILFETPRDGFKSFLLRTKIGKHKIKAVDLSHGTLLSIAFLTVAHLPKPPKIVCFEEPERGIHPRLLPNIQEAMDRLAYPENFGEKREPVQVIATTHSPYLLDLYKDRREEIVIADKDEKGVHFNQLNKLPQIEKVLKELDAPLGEIWFTGILGGVPA